MQRDKFILFRTVNIKPHGGKVLSRRCLDVIEHFYKTVPVPYFLLCIVMVVTQNVKVAGAFK